MRDVDVAKWSAEMTVQERVRLITALELKNWGSLAGAPSETVDAAPISPGIATDIHRAWTSCPPQQRAELGGLVMLKTLIWITAAWDVSERLMYLRGLAAEEALLLTTGRFSEGQLRYYATELARIVRELRHLVTLFAAAEVKHFGGMHLVGRDPSHPICTVWAVSRVIAEVVEGHKRRLLRVFAEPEETETPSAVDVPVHTLLLDANPAVDERWVEGQLFEMEKVAFGCW